MIPIESVSNLLAVAVIDVGVVESSRTGPLRIAGPELKHNPLSRPNDGNRLIYSCDKGYELNYSDTPGHMGTKYHNLLTFLKYLL